MKRYTFIQFQKEHKIIIPKIQRDYAQGRKEKASDKKIKSHDFIVKLIDVLAEKEPALNLDFIYGYTEIRYDGKKFFIPLDGQQRLTTLWLLHWYLSPKAESMQDGVKFLTVNSDVKSWLKDFTYETRKSSERFCEKLINEPLPETKDIYDKIKEAPWFMTAWLNDPTVISMLNMLKTIQSIEFDKENAWKNLTAAESEKITFDYIDIKAAEFTLSDELYIKMNSRGKPLTKFENFKAQISEILTSFIDETLEYKGKKISCREYFSFRIDSVWTDLFWSFVKTQYKDDDSNPGVVLDRGKLISNCFMNFFAYIAQMCYFKDNLDKDADSFDLEKPDLNVFKNKENALFLIKALDFFYNISVKGSNHVDIGRINTFFESIIQNSQNDDLYYEQVRFFDDKTVNLFEKCLIEERKENSGNTFMLRDRIILFSILSFMFKNELTEVNNELRCFVRVIRNLLQATRLKTEITFYPDIRINFFGNYWKLFNQLLETSNVYNRLIENINREKIVITAETLANEIEKAQIIKKFDIDNLASIPDITKALFLLEDFKHFGGLIHNLEPKNNVDNLIAWSKFIREIWSCEDSSIAASLITCGFSGFYNKGCALGRLLYFGNEKNWNTILASRKTDNLATLIISLLNKYGKIKLSNPVLAPEEILEKIINSYLESLEEKNWQYYFCKYRKYFLNGLNYFSWNNDKFEHEILNSQSVSPLVANHINPYVKTVANKLDKNICVEENCRIRYSEESKVVLKNDYHLYSRQDGWFIIPPEGQSIPDELIRKYKINVQNEQNILLEDDGLDRIETAVKFCKDLVS